MFKVKNKAIPSLFGETFISIYHRCRKGYIGNNFPDPKQKLKKTLISAKILNKAIIHITLMEQIIIVINQEAHRKPPL